MLSQCHIKKKKSNNYQVVYWLVIVGESEYSISNRFLSLKKLIKTLNQHKEQKTLLQNKLLPPQLLSFFHTGTITIHVHHSMQTHIKKKVNYQNISKPVQTDY